MKTHAVMSIKYVCSFICVTILHSVGVLGRKVLSSFTVPGRIMVLFPKASASPPMFLLSILNHDNLRRNAVPPCGQMISWIIQNAGWTDVSYSHFKHTACRGE